MQPAMDAAFVLSPVVFVKCGDGSGHYIHVRECGDDEGNNIKKCFHVKKDKITKLLTASVCEEFITNKKRPLTQTNIIEQIVKLRDDAFIELVQPRVRNGKRIRYGQKDAASKIAGLSDTMQVRLPEVHGVAARDATVLATRPGSELWIELTEDNIEYLSAVVAAQIENDEIIRKRVTRDADASSDSLIDDSPRLQAAGA